MIKLGETRVSSASRLSPTGCVLNAPGPRKLRKVPMAVNGLVQDEMYVWS